MTKVKFLKYFQGLTVLFPSLILSSLRETKGFKILQRNILMSKKKRCRVSNQFLPQ